MDQRKTTSRNFALNMIQVITNENGKIKLKIININKFYLKQLTHEL